jgi:oxygen-independent coproporphyrinogen-3 oxidase
MPGSLAGLGMHMAAPTETSVQPGEAAPALPVEQLGRLFEADRVPRYTSYPTAPHFRPDIGSVAAAEWLAALPPDQPASLYLHVPFCRQLCWYCGCTTHITRHAGRINAYAQTLARELDLVADHLREPVPLAHLHWGGGTPSSLGTADLATLMRRIDERFGFTADAERAIELDPRFVSTELADCLARIGINRASFGIQSFDPAVQRAINRIQSVDTTRLALERLRSAGIDAISFDILYGLPHQDVASVLDTVDSVAALAPGRVAVFGYAHLPGLKKHQSMIPDELLPDAAQRLAQFAAITERLEALGYVAIGLDHFARPDDPMARALEAGRLERNFQGYTTDRATTLIGVGASAIGSFKDGYLQNHVDLQAWRSAIAEGRLPIARGLRLSADDRHRRAIINRLMCEGRADLGAIADAHGAAAIAPEPGRFARLVELGIARREDDVILVPARYRPLLRLVAACFDRYLAPGQGRHSLAL